MIPVLLFLLPGLIVSNISSFISFFLQISEPKFDEFLSSSFSLNEALGFLSLYLSFLLLYLLGLTIKEQFIEFLSEPNLYSSELLFISLNLH